ncbi:MAG: hypothetical protein QXN66_04355 [Thermoplasmatales archaeon]
MELILLPLLLFSSYEDIKKRTINTLPYLTVDFLLLGIYLYLHSVLFVITIPVILEYFMKKRSYVPYVLVLIPVAFSFSALSVSLAYSIVLIKFFKTIVKEFGTGDVKVLQSIALAFPSYINLPPLDSLFPPVLLVMLVASAAGLVASLVNSHYRSAETSEDQTRFWIKGGKRSYKIPFVAFITSAYVFLLILSSLRLV